jgi:hypothetical protein
MINWKFDADDVACPVDDMKAAICFVQSGWCKERRKRVQGTN